MNKHSYAAHERSGMRKICPASDPRALNVSGIDNIRSPLIWHFYFMRKAYMQCNVMIRRYYEKIPVSCS